MEKSKTGQCYVKARISLKERELFSELARDIDVPYYLLMRHLVRYVLKDEIDWPELLKSIKGFPENSENPESPDGEEVKKVIMRTQIPPELYDAFSEFADMWGSTVNTVMSKLILLYTAGTIERQAILGPLDARLFLSFSSGTSVIHCEL
jgi:hypothetical protein